MFDFQATTKGRKCRLQYLSCPHTGSARVSADVVANFCSAKLKGHTLHASSHCKSFEVEALPKGFVLSAFLCSMVCSSASRLDRGELFLLSPSNASRMAPSLTDTSENQQV